jgi:hypothetical protein
MKGGVEHRLAGLVRYLAEHDPVSVPIGAGDSIRALIPGPDASISKPKRVNQ